MVSQLLFLACGQKSVDMVQGRAIAINKQNNTVSITLEDGALGGASFIIRLPARIVGSSASSVGAAAHPRGASQETGN